MAERTVFESIPRRHVLSLGPHASAWEAATSKVQDVYENEGYIYASVRPVVERKKLGKDSVPTVDLSWEIDERTPAIVNRVDIVGNDVTTETCIRDQLFILPGDERLWFAVTGFEAE